MLKLLFILSLIPLVTGLALRQLFFHPVKGIKGVEAQLTTEKLYKELFPKDLTLLSGKSLTANDGAVTLPDTLAKSKNLEAQLESLTPLGLIMLGKGSAKWLKLHSSLERFDTLFPSFGLILILFGVIAKSIPPGIGVLLLVITLGVTALNNLYLTWIRYQAYKLIKSRVERLPLYTKTEDRVMIPKFLKANVYKHALPKLLRRFL